MADLNIQQVAVSATPAVIYSGKGRLHLASGTNSYLCDSSGANAWNLTAYPLVLDLHEDTDVYGADATSGTISMIVLPLPKTATLVVDCGA